MMKWRNEAFAKQRGVGVTCVEEVESAGVGRKGLAESELVTESGTG